MAILSNGIEEISLIYYHNRMKNFFLKPVLIFSLFFQLCALKAEKDIDVYRNIERFIENLSLSEKAAQVLMINIGGSKRFSHNAKNMFVTCTPGAVILFKYNMASTPEKVRSYINSCKKEFETVSKSAGYKYLPPFFAADNEGGEVFRTVNLTSFIPDAEEMPKTFTVDEAESIYRYTAIQMKMMGIDFNLAPVAEPALPENKLFFKKRLYSADLETTALYSLACIRAMKSEKVLTAAKHFPANGMGDLHKEAVTISGTWQEFEKKYLPSFKRILAEEEPAILISHASVNCIENVPFCFSEKGLEKILRRQLKFDGMILTDDIAMQALKQNGKTSAENAIEALKAGCSMVMCSEKNIQVIIKAIEQHAAADKLFLKKLNKAVFFVLKAKYKIGLIDKNCNPLPPPNFDRENFYSAKSKAEKLLEKYIN